MFFTHTPVVDGDDTLIEIPGSLVVNDYGQWVPLIILHVNILG